MNRFGIQAVPAALVAFSATVVGNLDFFFFLL
jgi:hypothetical protein